MSRRRTWCAQCHKNKVEKNSPSFDYCIHCYESIKDRLENPMKYARAAGALVRATNDDRLKLAAFMSIFHPTYPEDKLRKLLA